VTLNSPLTYLDGKNCVFGRVIIGMRAFRMMERITGDAQDPAEKIQIYDCGDYRI